MKTSQSLQDVSLWAPVVFFVVLTTLRRFPELSFFLAIIISIVICILVYPRIRRWQVRSLNNYADAIIAFEFLALPAFLILVSLPEDIPVLTSDSDSGIIINFLLGCALVSVLVLRLLSTYSGAVLFWKLIANRNQGGPYSRRARAYQVISLIAWLIQILIFIVLFVQPDIYLML